MPSLKKKKKKKAYIAFVIRKKNKMKNMRKEQPFPTIVKIHIWLSHVHFTYRKIEAFWRNKPVKSVLQAAARFKPRGCLLPRSVRLSHPPMQQDSGIQAPEDWSFCSVPWRTGGGVQRLSTPLPHSPSCPSETVFLGNRRAKKKVGSEDLLELLGKREEQFMGSQRVGYD